QLDGDLLIAHAGVADAAVVSADDAAVGGELLEENRVPVGLGARVSVDQKQRLADPELAPAQLRAAGRRLRGPLLHRRSIPDRRWSRGGRYARLMRLGEIGPGPLLPPAGTTGQLIVRRVRGIALE